MRLIRYSMFLVVLILPMATGRTVGLSAATGGMASPALRGGGIVYAASCQQGDVQAAVDAAGDGDTVLVPAGDCTWTSPAAHTPIVTIQHKAITLRGAGVDATIIRDASGTQWGEYLIRVEGVEGKAFRISGFTFAGVDQAVGAIDIRGSSKRWRLDHCRFVDIAGPIFILGHTYGIIDHCAFYAHAPNSIAAYGSVIVGNENESWERPLSLGSAEAVFVEDCFFDYEQFGNVIDANTGGRYVFRGNTVHNSYVECHAFRQLTIRSTFSVEIYDNTFFADDDAITYAVMGLRGGTGVIYDNTATGVYNQGILVDNQRSCIVFDSGLCDGTNPLDGNEPGGQGYPCRDQIGRSTDSGLYTPQAQEPMYEWNNTFNGGDMDIGLNPAMCPLTAVHIQENRDYYNDTVRPNYTPYTYPHPLTQDVVLTVAPLDRSARLDWEVVTAFSFPVGTTWRIAYAGPGVPATVAASDLISATRSYTLTGLTNGVPYSVTLNGMVPLPAAGETPFYTATAVVTPTGPLLTLHGQPADRAIHLDWTVNVALPVTATWRIEYYTQTVTAPLSITAIVSPTRSYELTNLTNYAWYTVTLSAMLGSTSYLTDAVRVMPTDIAVYLPLMLRGK